MSTFHIENTKRLAFIFVETCATLKDKQKGGCTQYSAFWFVCGSPFLIPSQLHFITERTEPPSFRSSIMSEEEKQQHQIKIESEWQEEAMSAEHVRALHERIDREWSALQRTACQTAAGRALWNHVIHDPVAHVLAGERFLESLREKMRKDKLNNAREVSGVMLAVRTLWFDSKLDVAIKSFGEGEAQVVLLGAGMDARAYRLSCLKGSNVFEVDFSELLQIKASLIKEAMGGSAEQQKKKMTAKSVTGVAADIRDGDWLEKLQACGFSPEKSTVWVLEGILYYLPHIDAMKVLQTIAANSLLANTVLLADFMNESSASLSNSTYHFYSDWPDQLLEALGFLDIKLSQIGDPDANFGLLHDPQNLFNKLRSLPRSIKTNPEDGTPCRRLYLVEASGIPKQSV